MNDYHVHVWLTLNDDNQEISSFFSKLTDSLIPFFFYSFHRIVDLRNAEYYDWLQYPYHNESDDSIHHVAYGVSAPYSVFPVNMDTELFWLRNTECSK